jgi:hypothetical protein
VNPPRASSSRLEPRAVAFWRRYLPAPVSQPHTADMAQLVDDLVQHQGMAEPSHIIPGMHRTNTGRIVVGGAR